MLLLDEPLGLADLELPRVKNVRLELTVGPRRSSGGHWPILPSLPVPGRDGAVSHPTGSLSSSGIVRTKRMALGSPVIVAAAWASACA